MKSVLKATLRLVAWISAHVYSSIADKRMSLCLLSAAESVAKVAKSTNNSRCNDD